MSQLSIEKCIKTLYFFLKKDSFATNALRYRSELDFIPLLNIIMRNYYPQDKEQATGCEGWFK